MCGKNDSLWNLKIMLLLQTVELMAAMPKGLVKLEQPSVTGPQSDCVSVEDAPNNPC